MLFFVLIRTPADISFLLVLISVSFNFCWLSYHSFLSVQLPLTFFAFNFIQALATFLDFDSVDFCFVVR